VFEDDQLRCWGASVNGQTGYAATVSLGDNEMLDDLLPVMVGGTVMQFESGGAHTCAHLGADSVRCWGNNNQGQLGAGNTTVIGDTEHPSMGMQVDLGQEAVSLVAAGASHSCAIMASGELFCWGENNRGQLGYSGTQDVGNDELPISAGPVNVASPGLPVDATLTGLALGKEHSCALFSSGHVLCWGRNNVGQLGQGNTTDWGDSMNEPPAGLMPIDLGGVATSITAGDDFTCARIDDGSLRCWGQNNVGQLGQGNGNLIGDNEAPSAGMAVDVGGVAIQVSAGGVHACAVLEDYSVSCWGDGGQGQLGYGDTEDVGDDELPSVAGFVSVL
jgi:alpha-tubulin suppressor-like RCC1 family protein